MSINILAQPTEYSSINRRAILRWNDTNDSHSSSVNIQYDGDTYVTTFYPDVNGVYECDLDLLLKNFKSFENYVAYGVNYSNDIISVVIDIIVFYDDNGDPDFEDATINKRFLNNVYQLEELAPVQNSITWLHNQNELTFFKGYPFNISFLTVDQGKLRYRIEGSGNVNFIITQINNELLHWNVSNGISSLNFPEGVRNFTIDKLSIVNTLLYSATIKINTIENACGLYLKWFNTSGGWDGWLFSPYYKDVEKDKNEVLIDVDEAQEVLTKSVNRKLTLKSIGLNKNQYDLVRGLTYAKKVLWWINGKYTPVAVTSKNTHSTKALHGELEFIVELPKRFLQ